MYWQNTKKVSYFLGQKNDLKNLNIQEQIT